MINCVGLKLYLSFPVIFAILLELVIKIYLKDPLIIASSLTLSKFYLERLQNQTIINIIRHISFSHNDYQPQIRYLKLNGLYVETVWSVSRCIYVFISLLLSVIGGEKLIWGSWETIFGAGSFIVALPMLALTALSYYES